METKGTDGMRDLWKRLCSYMDRGLRQQLFFYLVVGVLLPFTVVASVLFLKTRMEMKNQAIGNIRQRADAIAAQVDELLYNVQLVSDKFAYDAEIEDFLARDYDRGTIEKQRDIYEMNNYFLKTDPLGKSQRISAIYGNNEEVYNFLDPYFQGEDIKRIMIDMGALDRTKLSMFQWQPLQSNFLSRTKKGDVRTDQVITCMRRILHPFTGTWLYTQFFVLEENQVYQLYKASAEEMKGTVYIVDGSGRLISSSDQNAVETCRMPGRIMELAEAAEEGSHQIQYNDEPYITDLSPLNNADWQIFTVVPLNAATEPIDRLFKEIIAAMVVCVTACIAIINWISRRFLQPVEVLDASMKEVYDGNLEAYVEPEAYQGEIKSMMMYYNAMLVQINHYIKEQVESEKKKKELELEVLMGQINPHFLYNTLENIVWKSNEVGRPDIGRIAAALGRLYRLSIGNGETIVPIRQEVEHVMAYVNIQKNRYKERIEFDSTVDYDQLYNYAMIKLTLQPVVENCFMYGMEGIDRVLKICLDIREEAEVIRFRVADNGCGMTRSQLKEVRRQIETGAVRCETEPGKRRRKGIGIGLYSVKERIAIYTGYQNSVRVLSKQGAGTIVIITVPKISVKDKNNQ